MLEKTIAEAESSQFSGQLQNQIDAARRKLEHLKVGPVSSIHCKVYERVNELAVIVTVIKSVLGVIL